MPTIEIARRWGTDFLKLALFTAGVGGCVVLFSGASDKIYAEIVLVHTFVIGTLCRLTIPHLGEYTEHWFLPWRWVAIVLSLLALGIGGTAIASVALHYGLPEVRGIRILDLFGNGLRPALAMTIAGGVITTLVVSSNDRLVLSRAVLQEQRLQRERAEKVAAEAQLASLASRVQPHFLFNTLNSIAALIRENPEQAEKTVERLAALLRFSLESSGNVPLEQELQLVRNYIEIQKTRLGEHLTFDVVGDPGIRAVVPAFSLQTLVENSVKHVAGRRHEGVRIHVRVIVDKDVFISVSDDGPGFDPTLMKPGGGLDILQARLHAAYGDRADLSFDRKPDSMTIRIRVPAC
jgi:two-component system sensor histidine kinase AlgZ